MTPSYPLANRTQQGVMNVAPTGLPVLCHQRVVLFAQELGNCLWVVFVQGHFFEAGEHCAPLLFVGEIAIIA